MAFVVEMHLFTRNFVTFVASTSHHIMHRVEFSRMQVSFRQTKASNSLTLGSCSVNNVGTNTRAGCFESSIIS